MKLGKMLSFGKEELLLVAVEVEEEERGDVVASFKSKTDRDSLTELARYIKELMYDENDSLKVGSYTLNDSGGNVLRRIKPKKERTVEDLSKLKQEEAMALLEKQRDASIASIATFKEMQETVKKVFGLEDGSVVDADEIEVPESITNIWDAMKQAYAKRAYKDIMAEPGNVGTTITNVSNMFIRIGNAAAKYLEEKPKMVAKKTDEEKKKEPPIEEKERSPKKTLEELVTGAIPVGEKLTAKVVKEGEKVLRTFSETGFESSDDTKGVEEVLDLTSGNDEDKDKDQEEEEKST